MGLTPKHQCGTNCSAGREEIVIHRRRIYRELPRQQDKNKAETTSLLCSSTGGVQSSSTAPAFGCKESCKHNQDTLASIHTKYFTH
ncbi:hypothetical protein ATANTOWER_018289 [Ataeniobius toweri]|uniref:Uncharacterized protein n=1 Tax=Ataeniobius toweri TaxID=208326 RepID=A0ABU7BNI6_9TELE|nr:hypothetical protein [Ataeniobius toweri]